MAFNFDLNYPPPGHDLFSLEAKYGVNIWHLIKEADYGYGINQVVIDLSIQQDRNKRIVSGDVPSAKRVKLNISRDSDNKFQYLVVDEVPKEDEPMPPTFNCSICLSTVDEETSTKCGHIFCKSCILAAIDAQHMCPICRRKLRRRDTFRVYLPKLKLGI